MYNHAAILKNSVQADKNHPVSHCKKVLEERSCRSWSKTEKDTFVKIIKNHGQDYERIQAEIPTKTRKQVASYRAVLYLTILRNPKHEHSALKKKLKPSVRDLTHWTDK